MTDQPFDRPEQQRAGRLDPADDPDRFAADGHGRSLPELLGTGAWEGDRDNYQWALGLLAVLGFLAAVAFLFGTVLSP